MAVPGETKSFHEAWKSFGALPWKSLIEPSIKLLKEGFTITKSFAKQLNGKQKPHVQNEPELRYLVLYYIYKGILLNQITKAG